MTVTERKLLATELLTLISRMFHSRATRHSWRPCLIPGGFSFGIHHATRLFSTVRWKRIPARWTWAACPEQLVANTWWNTGSRSSSRNLNPYPKISMQITNYTALEGRGLQHSLTRTLVQSASYVDRISLEKSSLEMTTLEISSLEISTLEMIDSRVWNGPSRPP